MGATAGRYYGRDLAHVHHRGFGAHASGCADGMLALLEPVRRSGAWCWSVVSVGHALSYLADADAIERSLIAIARALRPGGILAVDLCDLRWAALRGDQPTGGAVGEDWAVITESTVPAPNRFVRDICGPGTGRGGVATSGTRTC